MSNVNSRVMFVDKNFSKCRNLENYDKNSHYVRKKTVSFLNGVFNKICTLSIKCLHTILQVNTS